MLKRNVHYWKQVSKTITKSVHTVSRQNKNMSPRDLDQWRRIAWLDYGGLVRSCHHHQTICCKYYISAYHINIWSFTDILLFCVLDTLSSRCRYSKKQSPYSKWYLKHRWLRRIYNIYHRVRLAVSIRALVWWWHSLRWRIHLPIRLYFVRYIELKDLL